MIKKIFCIIISAVTSLSLCSCQNSAKTTTMVDADTLTITCFNVGKADAFLFKSCDETMIIDTGETKDADTVLNFLSKNDIQTIDYLILTHYDKDHIGSAAKIINNVEIKNIIASPNISDESDDYKKYVKAMDKKEITPQLPTENLTFDFNDAVVTVMPPKQDSYTDNAENNSSLVIEIDHFSNTLLFAGDAMNERTTELLNDGIKEFTLLKVPHHGQYETEYSQFFKAVNPKYAIITASQDYPADERTVSELNNICLSLYYTQNGNITILSDGNNLCFTQE